MVEIKADLKRVSETEAAALRDRPWSVRCIAHLLGRDFRLIRDTLERHEVPYVDAGTKHRKVHLYDLNDALPYILPPVGLDVTNVIMKMRPSQLPERLRKEIWDARLKEQTWRQRAGELWATEDVIEVLSDTFTLLASKIKLWSDQIADEHELSNDARAALLGRVDDLQADLHRALVEMPRRGAHRSQAFEYPDIAPSPARGEDPDEWGGADDDMEDLG